MTLPDERYRALVWMRDGLYEIAMEKGVVKKGVLRRKISSLLRHYPTHSEIDDMAKKCPKLLKKDTQNG